MALMEEAGFESGFDVTLEAIAAPRDYTQIAEIVREQLEPININVTVEPLEIGTFAENIGDGTFQWASTGRGMRGDPSGFVVDFRSGTANNVKWFGDGWKNEEIDASTTRRWRRRIRRSAWRLQAHPADHRRGRAEPLHRPAHQVPGGAISGSRACTSRTRTSIRGCGRRDGVA